MLLLRFIAALSLAWFAGQAARKLKLPPIIGWLIVAMFLGEHGIDLLNAPLISHPLYTSLFGIAQLALGSMIGYTLLYRNLQAKLKSVLAIALADIVFTFAVVSGVFVLALRQMHLPVAGSVLFGVIAVSTAPAPPVGLVHQYHCRGPLSDSVAPMTALNNVLATIIFFIVVAIMGARISETQSSLAADIAIVVLAPVALGFLCGFIAGRLVGAKRPRWFINATYLLLFFVLYLVCSCLNEHVFISARMMPILAGISFAATFVNILPPDKLAAFQKDFGPPHNYLFMFFIVNLSKDLNPFGLLSGGPVMLLYVLARALSKYAGCYLGARISRADEKVRRGMGIVMQPHSGVSIMFSGIGAKTLAPLSPELAALLQLTISAAALVIELISLPLSKLVYEKFHEIPQQNS